MRINKLNEPEQFNHIFGPVPSRRLGMSLGVDMVPFKTCSLNCVYCECGKTAPLTCNRSEYIQAKALINELDHFLASSPSIDVITFTGSGEPTLNTALNRVIEYVKTNYSEYKTALLTNSTLLHLSEVRQSIIPLDYVLPSIDAISQSIFEKINNPTPGLTSSTITEGLSAFSQEYTGTLWVEVFIIPGLNDTENELALLKKTLEEIKPDCVQLNTLDRPGACSWVKPAPTERLIQIANYLLPLPVEIIAREISHPKNDSENLQNTGNLLSTLKRRPMTVEDLSISICKSINATRTILEDLIVEKKVSTEKVGSKTFYLKQGTKFRNFQQGR